MSFKKTVAIAAAVGAMAAISVPAMAFENEFHGMYKFKTIFSNLDAGGTSSQSTFNPSSLNENNQTNNFLEQRARIMYIAKASDDLKLVTHFELDSRFGGTNTGKYSSTTDAGSLDADGVSLETKSVYLDFNVKPVNVKVGIQPYKDALKGVFLDADLAAVNTTTKIGALTIGAAFARMYDGSGIVIGTTNSNLNGGSSRVGDRNADAFLLDTKFAITKDASIGFSYYFVANYLNNINTLYGYPASAGLANFNFDRTDINTFALNGDVKVGPVALSGFAAMQAGVVKASKNTAPYAGKTANLHGYALNGAAKIAVGPGTLRAAGLFTSGDEGSDGQYNAWMPVKTINTNPTTGGSGSSVTSYNEGGTMLLVRNTAQNNTNTDKYVVGTLDNAGKGLGLLTLGYDANITPKFFVNTNLALGWAAKNAGAPKDGGTTALPGRANATNFMGAEVNVEAGYKIFDSLTASVQGAYLMLGGYYAGSAANSTPLSPKDPEKVGS